jgi:hypothetical protein
MEEHQNVVDWGVLVPLGAAPDPAVWQRVNGDQRAWYPEEMTFSEFVVRRLSFTRGVVMRSGPPPRTPRGDNRLS